MKQIIIITILFISACSNSNENDKTTSKSEEFISEEKKLIELAYKIEKSVSERDEQTLETLFAHPTALIWVTRNGIADGTYSPSSYTAQGLIDFVRDHTFSSLKQTEENINVVYIESGMAIMHTEYSVLIDGKLVTSGKEIYSLVKTRNGWKIVSIVFSRILH